MARYRKLFSNYVLRKRHMDINGGTIYERDWVTIGERHMLEPGKRPTYGSGGFVFTDNSRISTRKRHKYASEISTWTYDDVKDAKSQTNIVEVNMRSHDMRDYAYYGSCTELVRTTVQDIITWFPARITASTTVMYEAPYSEMPRYGLVNEFGIDINHTGIREEDMENPMRYLAVSWSKYKANGSQITDYKIVTEYPYPDCLPDNQDLMVQRVDIETAGGGHATLYGYYNYGDIVFTTDDKDLVIQPLDDVIEAYFDGLRGFASVLLDRNTKPLYRCTLITPIEVEESFGYGYARRDHVWPSSGYCIAGDGVPFEAYITELYRMASVFDEIWCDNIWRSMTHESIKNFDWTYTRTFLEGEEADNVEGGVVMSSTLHLYGRLFDDIKRSIDGIRFTNNVTLDGMNNLTDAELTDRLEMHGWDIVSTIPSLMNEFGETVSQSDTKIDKYRLYTGTAKETYEVPFPNGGVSERTSGHGKWFDGMNMENLTASDVDMEFMREMVLMSRHLARHKGTTHSVEMMLALFGLGRGVDYELHEGYHKVVPKRMFTEDGEGNIIDKTWDVRNEVYHLNHFDMESGNDTPIDYTPTETYDRIPLGEVFYKNRRYLIPRHENDLTYDSNFRFQSGGGWCKRGKDTEDTYTYTETMSYLRTAPTVSSLFEVSPRSVRTGDIFYVYDLSEYPSFVDIENLDDSASVSHFFAVMNEYDLSMFSSWKNVVMDPNASNFEDGELYRKALYLDGIISVNTGNNPHVGYGGYDMGRVYLDNMEQPFAQLTSSYDMEAETLDRMLSSDYTFSIDDYGCLADGEEETDSEGNLYADEGKVRMATECEGDDGVLNKYFLNDKTFVIENLHKGDTLFVQYFLNIILPYVSQMIPSTAMVVLDGFGEEAA